MKTPSRPIELKPIISLKQFSSIILTKRFHIGKMPLSWLNRIVQSWNSRKPLITSIFPISLMSKQVSTFHRAFKMFYKFYASVWIPVMNWLWSVFFCHSSLAMMRTFLRSYASHHPTHSYRVLRHRYLSLIKR